MCRDADTHLMIAVCDLNAFKEVNDRRGHLAGNRVLSLVAEGFRNACQGQETVARMGGDEFVFLLPHVTEKESTQKLEEISEAVNAASRRAGQGIRVSASLGAAFYPVDGTSAEELLALADRRMYLDKQRFYSSDRAASDVHMPAPALVACSK